jgi:2'-5' RNA ligase
VSSDASVGADGTLRLFLALDLPDDVRDELATWAAAALSGLRRVERERLHVTLAFLGRRPAGDADAVVALLRECATGAGPVPLSVARWRETRSVGMLVLEDPTGAAGRLAAALHTRLEAAGLYRPEQRPWLPHVTVARFAERPRLRPTLPRMGTFVPSDVAAYVSRLHPTGARYEALARVPLDPMEARRMTE